MVIIKALPNIITISRIVFTILLLLSKPLSTIFFILYILCGISDVLDGYIARALKCNTKAGALLDSIADVIFTFSSLIIFIPIIKWSKWIIIWIMIIVLIRMLSLAIGYIKYRTLAFLHIYSNKAAGLLFFCFPFMAVLFNLNVIVLLICTAATLSAIEEMMINLKSKKLERDIKSIFLLK